MVVRFSDRDPMVLRSLTGRVVALGDILTVREFGASGAVTVEARSVVHLPDAHVSAAIG